MKLYWISLQTRPFQWKITSWVCQEGLTTKQGLDASEMSRSRALSLKTASALMESLVSRSQQVCSQQALLPLGICLTSFKQSCWAWGLGHSTEALGLAGLQLLRCMLSVQWSIKGSGKGQPVSLMKAGLLGPPAPRTLWKPINGVSDPSLFCYTSFWCPTAPVLITTSHLSPPALAPELTLSFLPCYWQP